MRRVLLILACLIVGALSAEDFDTFMGLNIPSISEQVKTQEDFKNLRFFRKYYEKNRTGSPVYLSHERIPKVIHFLWLGSDELAKGVIHNIESWVKHHPYWRIKFWSDREQKDIPSTIETKQLKDFAFLRLKNVFDSAQHLAEKADLLRYEILAQEGGVFIDLGMKCSTSLDPLHDGFDFFAGLQTIRAPITSSSILVCEHIIGSKAHHPILLATMDLINSKWDMVGQFFQGMDLKFVKQRMVYRSQSSLDEAIKGHFNKEGNFDIVFPTGYFFRIAKEFGLYAEKVLPNPMFIAKNELEKSTFERLDTLTRKNRLISVMNFGIFFFNLLIALTLLIIFKKWNKRKAAVS